MPEMAGNAATRCSHRMHVVASQTTGLVPVHLVRLQAEADFAQRYFLKTADEFGALVEALKGYKVFSGLQFDLLSGGMSQKGRIGFRRALSRLADSSAHVEEATRIERGMGLVLDKVERLRDVPALVDFFKVDITHRKDIVQMVVRLRTPLSLLSVAGHWRTVCTKRMWLLLEDGTALLDGRRHAGADYDLHHDTSHGYMSSTIFRKDGWSIDMDRSVSKEKLIWVKPGLPPGEKAELVWRRLTKEEAQSAVDDAEKYKDKIQNEERIENKRRIREAIMQRIAAPRAAADNAASEKNDMTEPSTCGSEDLKDPGRGAHDLADDPRAEA